MKKYKINFIKEINILFYLTLFIFIVDIIINIIFIASGASNISNIKNFNGSTGEIIQNNINITINSIFFAVAIIAIVILLSTYFNSKCYVSEKFITYKYGFFKKEIKHFSVIGIKIEKKNVVIVFYKKEKQEKYVATKINKEMESFLNDIKKFNQNIYVERI